MTADEYKKKWDAFSWQLGEAIASFFALLGSMEWQDALLSRVKSGSPMHSSPHTDAVMIFSNAILDHFFISACRIRETANTQLSLPVLFDDAADALPLDSALAASIQALIDKTKGPFERIKKVRGMTVAHLHGVGSPFAVLKREKVTREMISEYLEDCATLFALLGQPIGRDFPTDLGRFQSSQAAVLAAFHQLWSLHPT